MSLSNIGSSETAMRAAQEEKKLRGLANRRQERASRLLDPRQMKYNADTRQLRMQRKAKRQADFAAKKSAQKDADYEKAMNEAAERYAREMHLQKLKNKLKLESDWKVQMRMRSSTNPEFDLSDRRALRNDRPARVGDNDERCGASSLQMFAGEDLGRQKRLKQQAEALQVAHNEQVARKKAVKEQERQRESEWASFVSATTRIRAMNAVAKYRQQQQQEFQESQINKSMARMVRQTNKQQKAEADALANLEKELLLGSKVLAEDRSVFETSMLGPNRVRTDHFKGFSKAQLKAIYAENALQQQENQAKREVDRAREASYAAHVKNVNAIANQQQVARFCEQQRQDLVLNAQQKNQKRKHKARAKAESDRIMNQTFTKEFFGSFGQMQ